MTAIMRSPIAVVRASMFVIRQRRDEIEDRTPRHFTEMLIAVPRQRW